MNNLENLSIGSGSIASTVGFTEILTGNPFTVVIGIITALVGLVSALIGLGMKIYNAYRNADTNDDGKVDAKEFINAIKSLDMKESAKDIKDKVKDIQDILNNKENDNGN